MKRITIKCTAFLLLILLAGCSKNLNNRIQDGDHSTKQDTAQNITMTDAPKEDDQQDGTVTESPKDDSQQNRTVTTTPKEEEEKSDSVDVDSFVGEYNDYDTDEPRLEIQKNDDGTFKIQIGIYRLIQLYECVGVAAQDGIEFSTEEIGKEISGTITVENGIATVKFSGAGWNDYSSVDEYQYDKTSDVPNIYEYQ